MLVFISIGSPPGARAAALDPLPENGKILSLP